jgi:prevent-host-death family protein
MNMTIGLADAKARLSEVIDRVEAGETILIARNGQPVAELRPIRPVSPREAVERIRAIGKRVARRNAKKEPWPSGDRNARAKVHKGHRF